MCALSGSAEEQRGRRVCGGDHPESPVNHIRARSYPAPSVRPRFTEPRRRGGSPTRPAFPASGARSCPYGTTAGRAVPRLSSGVFQRRCSERPRAKVRETIARFAAPIGPREALRLNASRGAFSFSGVVLWRARRAGLAWFSMVQNRSVAPPPPTATLRVWSLFRSGHRR
jgi:hypothetical protein